MRGLMPKLDEGQMFLVQLIGLLIVAISLTVAAYKLGDVELKTLAAMAWGGLLTLLKPK